MSLLKACPGCGDLSATTWCTTCRPVQEKGSATTRGYDAAWNRLSTRARRLQPWCEDCGTTDDLTTDHSPEAWQRKNAGLPIRLADVAVVCRACNARRGQARPTATTPGDPPRRSAGPSGKADFAIHTCEGSGGGL